MKGILNHASIIISLTLAALYAIGLMYHLSFLKAFGIEETQFPLPIDRVFFQGFFASADLTAPNLSLVIICAAGVFFIAQLAIFITGLEKQSNFIKLMLLETRDFFYKKQQTRELPEFLEGFSKFSTTAFGYVIAGVFFYLSILLVLMAAEHSGSKNAELYKIKIKNNEVAVDELLVEVRKGQFEEYKGFSIVCNSHQCAYFDGEISSVFNNKDVRQLHSKPVVD